MRRAALEPDEMPPADKKAGQLMLPDRVAHYVRDVLRMSEGDRVELFDGSGRVIDVELQRVSERHVIAKILRNRTTDRGESPCAITLFQAIPKGKRWETLLEKVTELGVARIVPLETRRTVVQIKGKKVDRKLDRWERVIDAAARQCQRTVTPEIIEPRAVPDALDLVDGPSFVAHTDERPRSVRDVIESEGLSDADCDAASIWIGPEGGFDEDEIDALTDAGVHPCHMGPRILRSETAGIVGVSLLQALLGDLS
ncbi:MAG: 16S rRNA (uracil(1498)-N(3))-methyltransferase [Myxococcota bacterium]